jgi:hypothetical protein
MEKVILKPLFHRNTECIGIYYKHNAGITNAIRNNLSARWSNTKKVWWIPLSKDNYEALKSSLEGLAQMEYGELQSYLLEKKKSNLPSQVK